MNPASPRLLPLAAALGLLACTTSTQPMAPAPAPQADTAESVPFDHGHRLWSQVLARHVRGDAFDYRALKEAPADLEAYLRQLHAVTPAQLEGWTREQRFAFWINAYNAHTIQKVVEHYPLGSIRDLDRGFGLKSVFDDEFIPMRALHPEGKDDDLSLNDIENGILRARFQDARVHTAINCASESCPPLLAEAFVAERLEEQLDAQMRAFVADRQRNRFDREKGEARVSEIFKWFKDDFQRGAGSVRDYLIRYASPQDASFLREAKIAYVDYSWDLNDVSR